MSSPNPPDILVEHAPAAQQFFVRWNGARAVLQYRLARRTIFFVHTEVPPRFQHHGVADAMARAGLEFARERQLAVVPRCPFVADYIRRHPEYQQLLRSEKPAAQ